MANIQIEIRESLVKDIVKRFGEKKATKILESFKTLEKNPKKGKLIGSLKGYLIKELKFESFRFYFILDGFRLKLLSSLELKEFIIKFVAMSKKNNQQKTINEIKKLLLNLGFKNL